MNLQTNWTKGFLKCGVVVVVTGLVMTVVGLVLPGFIASLTLSGRLITTSGPFIVVYNY